MTNEQYKECEGYKEEAIKEIRRGDVIREVYEKWKGVMDGDDYDDAHMITKLDIIGKSLEDMWKAIKKYCEGVDMPNPTREVHELLDGCYDIIEIYNATTPAQKEWKKNWLKKAKNAIKEYCEEGWEIHKMEDEQDCESIQKLDNMVFPQGEALEQNFPEGQ